MQNHDFDIIIIGAGVVGLTLAAKFIASDLRVAIIENAPEPTEKTSTSYDIRVSAITVRSENIFREFSAWDEMQSRRVSPFRKMHVWDALGNGSVDFASADIGEPHLGHIIENSVLRDALISCLRNAENCQFFYNKQLTDLIITKDNVTVVCQDGDKFTSKLSIGADGAKSWLRNKAYIPVTNEDYHHHAIITTVETELPHRQTAMQRFLGDGVLAFLPLSDRNHCSIVWSTIPENAKQLCGLDDESFAAKLALAFENKLGAIRILDRRMSFPLQMQHARDYVMPRIALVGDAAHTIHPLAGQGVNLGIADANCLGDTIIQARKKGKDIGALAVLQQYRRARIGENLLMINLMAGFKKLFASENKAIIQVRNLGLNLTNKLFPIKNFFIRQAMGL